VHSADADRLAPVQVSPVMLKGALGPETEVTVNVPVPELLTVTCRVEALPCSTATPKSTDAAGVVEIAGVPPPPEAPLTPPPPEELPPPPPPPQPKMNTALMTRVVYKAKLRKGKRFIGSLLMLVFPERRSL
jgi:hypothetical protein